jgi:putative FmdB family regulatory protein
VPTHEYSCDHCDHITEVTFSITDKYPEFLPCGKCARPAKHIISLSTFVLKGGGWADTGYDKKAVKESPKIPTPT